MNYKNAFKCKKCPQSNNEDGCPCWIELMMTNTRTGDEKIEKGCTYQLMPIMMIEVIKASNRPAEELGKMSNNFVKGLNVISGAIGKISPNSTIGVGDGKG